MAAQKPYSRRRALALGCRAALGAGLLSGFDWRRTERSRPSLYVTRDEIQGLRSLSAVRKSVGSGVQSSDYNAIKAAVQATIRLDPIVPSTPVEGRSPAAIANANPDYYVTDAAGQRVLRSAFVALIEEDAALLEPAMRQLECLFDDSRWPKWIDQAHEVFGHPVDLRTGMLAESLSLAYDWMSPLLTAEDRRAVVEGLDRRAVQPFIAALDQDPWWMRDKNNWMTTIVGGMGIAGMSLQPDLPDADFLVTLGVERFEDYLSIYGPAGEFNESVAYANATIRPVAFFHAHRYWTMGRSNRLASPPFHATCRWSQYLTLPPGRVAAFGDSHIDAVPRVSYVAPVAAATGDRVLAWYSDRYREKAADPVALLWHDPSLPFQSPEDGDWALGAHFPAQGGCMVARTDWSPTAARCIVYGKSGREENHEHNDVGQVCIDAYGDRLIVDLGSPSSYPADYFDEGRYKYYNASVKGHNILMFDDREMPVPIRKRGEPIGDKARVLSGSVVDSKFEDGKGAAWTIDCTNAYSSVDRVLRSVVFLTPGIVAILDEAWLPTVQDVSLRWHTAVECTVSKDGSFGFATANARLRAHIISLCGPMVHSARSHRYEAPYDHGREGDLLTQRREPYIESRITVSRFAALSLFYAGAVDEEVDWRPNDGRWILAAADVEAVVETTEKEFAVTDLRDGRRWSLDRVRA